jgi:hypothetical protein
MDNWEDWDNEDNYCLPNEEQLKVLEERKLVEETDIALTKSLFEYEDDLAYQEHDLSYQEHDLAYQEHDLSYQEHDLAYQEVNKNSITFLPEKKELKKKDMSRKEANEQKQKELSIKNKQDKAKKERERELFGQATENEYAKYEDMFY